MTAEPTGQVNRIIDCSLIDGPGSRMAIFLQGCDLDCRYCHNPETKRHCTGCGACVAVCPRGALMPASAGRPVGWNADRCQACDACLHACPHSASPRVTTVTADQLFARIAAAQDFLAGVTFSGGECTLQAGFLLALCQRIRERTRLTTLIDTNGCLDETTLARLAAVSDGFLFDLKAFTVDIHRRLTGADNGRVLANLRTAAALDRLVEVRTVIVPGFNDTAAEVNALARFVADLSGTVRYRLIPFRPAGVSGELATLPALDPATLIRLCTLARTVLGERVIQGR